MSCTVKVEVDEEIYAWSVFVDRRPVTDFNRELEKPLILQPGEHRLAINLWGSGSTLKIWISGGARLLDPDKDWPVVLTVPKNMASHGDSLRFAL